MGNRVCEAMAIFVYDNTAFAGRGAVDYGLVDGRAVIIIAAGGRIDTAQVAGVDVLAEPFFIYFRIRIVDKSPRFRLVEFDIGLIERSETALYIKIV